PEGGCKRQGGGAWKDAPRLGRPDTLARQLHQPVRLARLQLPERVGEVRVEDDAELPLALRLDDDAVAEEVADHGAPQPVLGAHPDSPKAGRPVGGTGPGV